LCGIIGQVFDGGRLIVENLFAKVVDSFLICCWIWWR